MKLCRPTRFYTCWPSARRWQSVVGRCERRPHGLHPPTTLQAEVGRAVSISAHPQLPTIHCPRTWSCSQGGCRHSHSGLNCPRTPAGAPGGVERPSISRVSDDAGELGTTTKTGRCKPSWWRVFADLREIHQPLDALGDSEPPRVVLALHALGPHMRRASARRRRISSASACQPTVFLQTVLVFAIVVLRQLSGEKVCAGGIRERSDWVRPSSRALGSRHSLSVSSAFGPAPAQPPQPSEGQTNQDCCQCPQHGAQHPRCARHLARGRWRQGRGW